MTETRFVRSTSNRNNLLKSAIASPSPLPHIHDKIAELERQIEDLRRQNARLEERALCDSLTGLHNRRYLIEFLGRELAQCRRYRTPLSLILLNIDHFGAYNENYGQAAGDIALQKIVSVLLGHTRTNDVATRYSAEVFAIALPCTDAPGAHHLAERLRVATGQQTIEGHYFTISGGVSTLPDYGGTVASLTHEAETALHHAKRQGKNRALHYLDVMEPPRHALKKNAKTESLLLPITSDLMKDLTPIYEATIHGWLRVLEMKDSETEGHSERVTSMTLRLARHLGMGEEELVAVRWGALLHDIGKIGVPDSILQKPGSLTPEEWDIMRLHPVYAYEMLLPIPFLQPTLSIPYCHHEKWDGSGYPRGLRGEEIPFMARLFSVIDVWDALCSDRPYRKAWEQERALEHIRANSGTQFDSAVVEAFDSLYREGDSLLCHPHDIQTFPALG